MYETKDERVVRKLLQPFIGNISGDFSENLSNVFLVEGDNLAMFEELSPGVFRGHYFFNSARGKAAKTLAIKALDEIFKTAKIIQGWTPLEKRGAALLSRWLGFTSYGIIDDKFELFILTKEEWKTTYGRHLRWIEK